MIGFKNSNKKRNTKSRKIYKSVLCVKISNLWYILCVIMALACLAGDLILRLRCQIRHFLNVLTTHVLRQFITVLFLEYSRTQTNTFKNWVLTMLTLLSQFLPVLVSIVNSSFKTLVYWQKVYIANVVQGIVSNVNKSLMNLVLVNKKNSG